MTSKEQCGICLQDLSHDIGAFVPCGHCIHVNCFKEYLADHRKTSRKKLKRSSISHSDTSTTINSPLPRCPICLSGAVHFQRIFLTSSPLPAVQRGGVVVSEQQREDGYSTPPAKTTSPTAALTAVTERTTKPEPERQSTKRTYDGTCTNANNCTIENDEKKTPCSSCNLPNGGHEYRNSCPHVATRPPALDSPPVGPTNKKQNKQQGIQYHELREGGTANGSTRSTRPSLSTSTTAVVQTSHDDEQFPSVLNDLEKIARVQYQTMLIQHEINHVQNEVAEMYALRAMHNARMQEMNFLKKE